MILKALAANPLPAAGLPSAVAVFKVLIRTAFFHDDLREFFSFKFDFSGRVFSSRNAVDRGNQPERAGVSPLRGKRNERWLRGVLRGFS